MHDRCLEVVMKWIMAKNLKLSPDDGYIIAKSGNKVVASVRQHSTPIVRSSKVLFYPWKLQCFWWPGKLVASFDC